MVKEREYLACCPRENCGLPLEAEGDHDMSEGLHSHCPTHGAIFVEKEKPILQYFSHFKL